MLDLQQLATLTSRQRSASTAYIFESARVHVVVYNGGTLNVGTSGTPVPGTSTVLFEFQCTNAGDFGLVARNGSAVNMYGVPRTGGSVFSWTKLTANLSASGTSLTTSDSTGWLSGDVIAIASTDQTASHIEKKILSGNASGTAISITVGVTNAHSGTSPTQAEVALLTRNVVFTSPGHHSNKSFFPAYWPHRDGELPMDRVLVPVAERRREIWALYHHDDRHLGADQLLFDPRLRDALRSGRVTGASAQQLHLHLQRSLQQ